MKRTILIALLIMSALMSTRAQMGNLYNADNQLPSSFTNQVFVDNDGLLWGATRNGLCCYDGYQFRIFNKESGTGMANNYVNCIAQDRHNLMYLGMFGALQTYDGSTFSTVKVTDLSGHESSCYIICFLERKSGEMLVGTSGCGVLQMTSLKEAHQLGGDLSQVATVHNMAEDSKGRVWIVTDQQGVLVWHKGKVVERYFQEEPLRSCVRSICFDKAGNIYIGTLRQGVFRRNGNTFTHIDGTANKPVPVIYCRSNGQVVIGYDGAGLAIYDPATGSIVENPYYSRMLDLAQGKVLSITEDHSGNLWLGLLQKGIYMQPASQGGFSYMGYRLGKNNIIGQACVTSTMVDSRGNVWVGTDKDGLYQLSPSLSLVRHYTSDVPATVLSLNEDKQGRIWLGSYQEGCGWLDASGNYHQQQLPQGWRVSVFGIACDPKGDVWLATMGNGLIRIAADGAVKSYTMKSEAIDNRHLNSLTNDYISHMSLSPDGKRIYLATTMGTCCLDIEHESWVTTFGQNCLMYGTSVFTVKEFGGRLLMATSDSLLCYDLLAHRMEQYATDNMQIGSGVASMEQDQRGRLWISSYRGLCCYDPKTGSAENFFVDDGLQSNEFSAGASWTAPNGLMLFGGVGGITWFDPLKISQKEWKAHVKLTAFLINGEHIGSTTRSGHYNVCDTSVIASDRFDLSYRDNSFTIQLSTLTYDTPEHITYIYQINNEAPVRLQPGKNEITFSHLTPGTYKFRIKAERNSVQTEERVFTVVVHSPWFRTWWAYCLYALLLGVGIWQYLRQRSRSEQDRLRLQEHIHAEEMGEAKLRFFMNISHEIRTPMTLIITPLLSLMKQDDDPHRRSVYETIRRNAERILSLINQLMDLRKIDKGMMQMHMSKTDLVPFVQDIYTLFEHQAQMKRVSFRYQHDTDQLPVWIDRRQFDKVVVNILSNAFKFTPPGGDILIRVSHDDQHATIAVSDNGEAIPEDKIQHIFKRFYQTTTHANDRNTGTGIGLDLTRSLVELHHGTILARNLNAEEASTLLTGDSKQGVEFVVTIPLGKAHLTEDEIDVEAPADNSLAQAELNGVEEEEMNKLLDNDSAEWNAEKNRRQIIVIVEDDDEIRDYLTQELSGDYDIRSCTNGREALAETLKCLPDLVLSDVMMPEMDGNTLAATLKTNPQTNHIPIVLLTAKNRDEDKLEGLGTGVDAYIVKPFNMDILRRTIVNLISSRRMLRLKYGRNDELESKVQKVEMKSPDEKLLERIMKVINENISNSDLSVDTIASTVGISRVHLHRKMKELTGQTPHDFIRNIRLKQAAHLLSTGDMNVTEVMYACGFSNSASFSTIFKRFYGMTPRDYKNS